MRLQPVLCIFTWFVPFFAFQAKAQSSFAPIIHELTSRQGLSQSTNAFIYKDSYGYVWVSSIDGLNRFDGRKAKVYKSNPDDPTALYGSILQSPFFEDGQGDIWFSTDLGINCFRRRTGKFDRFLVREGSKIYKDSLYYAFHLEETGHLWVKAGSSLFLFDTKNGESQPLHPLTAVRCAVQSAKGRPFVRNLYACYWNMGEGFDVIEYDESGNSISHKSWFKKKGQPADYTLTVRQCVIENDSMVWFATYGGLLGFDPKRSVYYGPYRIAGQKDARIRSIALGSGKNMIVASSDGELYCFDTFKKEFGQKIIKGSDRGIYSPVSNASEVFFERDTTMWYSSMGYGVHFSKFRKKHFSNPLLAHRLTPLKAVQIFESAANQAIICVAERDTIYVLNNGREKSLAGKLLMPPLSKFFQEKNGTVWNSSIAGITRYNSKSTKKRYITLGNRQEYITDIQQLNEQMLYVGTFSGLYVLETAHDRTKRINNINYTILSLMLDSKNRLWIGSNNKLIVTKATESLHERPIKVYANTGITNHIVEDKKNGLIWVATSNGLLKINAETLADTLVSERSGLPNQYIYAIVLDNRDNRDNLWLSTNQGIIKYMPSRRQGQQFKQYTTRNGLSANEYCRGAALLSSNGEIWFGSTQGVDVFHPNSVRDIGTAPQLAIVGLKIHDTDWHNDTVCIEMARRIELEHDRNTLRIELAAMEYTDPEMNLFKVRLLNAANKSDTAWTDLGTQNFITYANLPPSRYFFQFTACNAEGIWQKTPRTLEIVINPHFTQTWQFRSLMAVLALGMIGFGIAFYYRYRLRVQQLELEKQQREADRKQLLLEKELALQRERNRIADEMHDELGGGLSTIRLASERAKKLQSSEELQNILSRVSQISIGLVNNMRGIIWAMDTQNDHLSNLLAYLRQYARQFLDDNGLAAHLEIPADFADLPLTGQYRHNILLTVKECLNNIVKHANAQKVSVRVSLDDELLIVIHDDGKGFDPAEKAGSGKGLRTTAKRMNSVGGSIQWARNDTGGMDTILRAPLPA